MISKLRLSIQKCRHCDQMCMCLAETLKQQIVLLPLDPHSSPVRMERVRCAATTTTTTKAILAATTTTSNRPATKCRTQPRGWNHIKPAARMAKIVKSWLDLRRTKHTMTVISLSRYQQTLHESTFGEHLLSYMISRPLTWLSLYPV